MLDMCTATASRSSSSSSRATNIVVNHPTTSHKLELSQILDACNMNAIDYYNFFSNDRRIELKSLLNTNDSFPQKTTARRNQQQQQPQQPPPKRTRQSVCMNAGNRIKPSEMRYCSDKKREAIVHKILQEEKIKQIRRSLAEYEQFRNYIDGLNSSDEKSIEENVNICIETNGSLIASLSSSNDDDSTQNSNFFGSLCLSFNAKLGLIQQEVDVLDENLNEAESEIMTLQKRVHALEVELEQSERKLYETTNRLEEVNTAVVESERGRQLLYQKNGKYEEEIDHLESHFDAIRTFATESDQKMEQIFEKWINVERQLEMIDQKATNTESKTAVIEKDLDLFKREYIGTKNKFNSYTKKEEQYNEQIKSLNNKLVEVESRSDLSGATTLKLLKLVERMEDILTKESESAESLECDGIESYPCGFR